MALFGSKDDGVGNYWDESESFNLHLKNKNCDHIVSAIPGCEQTEECEYMHRVQIVRASEYHTYYHNVYTNEKFDFCPNCGEKINWKKLEDKTGR